MKINWKCRIWGHSFMGIYQRLEDGKDITTRSPVAFCVRCGLSKEEIKENENLTH